MKIVNGQGFDSAVTDAVAPFLGAVKDVLPLFEEPEAFVGSGAVAASLHLFSRRADIPGDAVERILMAARLSDLSPRVSAGYRDGTQGLLIEIAIFGFVVF